jgi:small nuclear ribonucleoprotein (snRNP)-like protein
MTAEDFLDDMPLESEYSNEEPEDVVIDPSEFEYPEEDIELEEPMIIPQEDYNYNMVLEKGDRIKILSKNKIEENFTSPIYEAEGNMITYHGVDYPILTKDNIKEFFTVLSKDLPSTIVVSFHGSGDSRLTSILFPKKIVIRGNTIEIVSKVNSISSGYLNIVLSEIVEITSVNFGKTFHFMLRPNTEVSVTVDSLDVEI